MLCLAGGFRIVRIETTRKWALIEDDDVEVSAGYALKTDDRVEDLMDDQTTVKGCALKTGHLQILMRAETRIRRSCRRNEARHDVHPLYQSQGSCENSPTYKDLHSMVTACAEFLHRQS